MEGYPESWIEWCCRQPGHAFFCEVESSFIEDSFNLYGLANEVPRYNDCLNQILGYPPKTDQEGLSHPLYTPCVTLYGLIHARFILTAPGISRMADKMDDACFGTCPRFLCGDTPVLPLGLSAELHQHNLLLFCPRCEEAYAPPPRRSPSAADLDGAFFGPTFPHLLLLQGKAALNKTTEEYTPRIYGFRVASQRGRASLADSCIGYGPFRASAAAASSSTVPRVGGFGVSALGTRGYAGVAAGSSSRSAVALPLPPFRSGSLPLTSPYSPAAVAGAGASAEAPNPGAGGLAVDDFLDEEDELGAGGKPGQRPAAGGGSGHSAKRRKT